MNAEFTHRGEKVIIRGFAENDWIYKSIVTSSSYYELDLLEYMKFVLAGRNGYIIDVGANIGNHSIFLAKHVANRVVCFEPNAPVFEILVENLTTNNVKHQSFKMGLGSESSLCAIDQTNVNAQDNIGAVRLNPHIPGDIVIKKLDEVIQQFPSRNREEPPVAIKIDVEGMEPQVLLGARETLTKWQPELFIEAANASALNQIEEILTPLGYVKLSRHAGTPVWHFSPSGRWQSAVRARIFPLFWFPYRVLRKLSKLVA